MLTDKFEEKCVSLNQYVVTELTNLIATLGHTVHTLTHKGYSKDLHDGKMSQRLIVIEKAYCEQLQWATAWKLVEDHNEDAEN